MNGKGALKVSDLVVRHSNTAAGSPRPATADFAPAGAPQATAAAPEAQIEFQDVLNSMARYKWHGLVAALLIGLAGYFLFASGYQPRYTAEASVMRRESGLPIYFLLREEGKRINRTFDGDVSYLQSERVAEVAHLIGRAVLNIHAIEPQHKREHVLAQIRQEADGRDSGTSQVEIVETESGDKLFEFHNFGLTAILPADERGSDAVAAGAAATAWDGWSDWRLRRLGRARELPAEYLNGIEMTREAERGYPEQVVRVLVAWNTSGRQRFDQSDDPAVSRDRAKRDALDGARATLRRLVPGLARFEAESLGTLAEVIDVRRSALGVAPEQLPIAAAARLTDGDLSRHTPENPSTVLLSYRTLAGETVFVAQVLTADCVFLIDHRVRADSQAVRDAAEIRFLRLLATLEFQGVPGFRQLFESETEVLDAVYRQGGATAEAAPNWVAIDRRGLTVDPRRALSTESDALIVPNPLMALLLDIYQGRQPREPLAVGHEGDDADGAGNAAAARISGAAGPLPITPADQEAIRVLLSGPSEQLISMLTVEGESSSGRLQLQAQHENRHVAAFLANLMLVAFVADNARLSMERMRDDVRIREQHLQQDRAQLRNMKNALGRLRQEANQRLLDEMVFGVFPAIEMTEGDMQRELSATENEQVELALRIAALRDEVASLARRLQQLSFPPEQQVVDDLERELRANREPVGDYDPLRDPVVSDVDRRINEVRLDLQRSIRRDTLEENPLVPRLRRDLQALEEYRAELVEQRRREWELTHRFDGLNSEDNPENLSPVELFERRKQQALDQRNQRVARALADLDAGWLSELRQATALIEGLTRQERVTAAQLAQINANLPQAPVIETDPRITLGLFTEQDMRAKLAALEAAIARWLTATRKRTDLVAQMAAYQRTFSPVETYRFDVEAMEQRVRASVAKLQEARVNATRLPDDYEWQRSADPRLARLEGRTLLLLGILLVSLVGGLFVARLWDLVDTRIKTDLQVKEITGLPILGHLPVLSANERFIRIGEDGRVTGRNIAANLFGILGANLRHAVGADGGMAICVTSAVPREGKSLVAYDLACYYAIEGYRTCLLLADVRNPSTEVFGNLDQTVTAGFVDHLREPERVALDEALYSTGIDTLHICFPGSVPINPVRVFDEVRFPRMLAALKQHFDIVVVDAPPVVPVVDGTLISRHVDGTLLVVRVGHALKRDVAATIDRLRFIGAPVLGVMVNADPTYRQRAYYYYYRRGDLPSIDRLPALDGEGAEPDGEAASGTATPAPALRRGMRRKGGTDIGARSAGGGNPAVPEVPGAYNPFDDGNGHPRYATRNGSSGMLPRPSTNGSSTTLPRPMVNGSSGTLPRPGDGSRGPYGR